MTQASSSVRLRAAIDADQRRIAAGERPLYHATPTTTPDGTTVDVAIRELPTIHVFVPDHVRVLDGARGLIARTLSVVPRSFDVVIDEPSSYGLADLGEAPMS